MLKHRLLVGIPMAAAALGLLALDPGPIFPGLALLASLAGQLAAIELCRLMPDGWRVREREAAAGVVALLWANWSGVLPVGNQPAAWAVVLFVFVGLVLAAGVAEVLRYRLDGRASCRLVGFVFALVYLGLLPSFLVRLRWLPGGGLWAVLATIFVPKVGDIGAYFTGRLFGRHKLAPALSPKKTWEGFVGGLVASAGTAVGASYATPTLFPHGPPEAVAFGLLIGTAGVLGDLFESMFKRDAGMKDAAKTLPGFGGVLDVIDSVLFAAPVAYLWFTIH